MQNSLKISLAKFAKQWRKTELDYRQITLAFVTPINKYELAAILKKLYGDVIIGEGRFTNDLPEDWIVIENDKQR